MRDTFLLLAPLCRDEIVQGGRVTVRPGGAGLYAAWALARLGARVRLHTPLAPGDEGLLSALPPGTETIRHPTRATTSFRIAQDQTTTNIRSLQITAVSDPLTPALLGDLREARSILFCPLLPSDADPVLLAILRAANRTCDLGVQGLVRRITSAGVISVAAPAAPLALLPPLSIIAGNEEEITALAGAAHAGEAMDRLVGGIAEEVIVTAGDRGAWIRTRGSTTEIRIDPIPPGKPPIHPIGLGDTFLAVYGWARRLGASPEDAGRQAAGAATDLLENGLPTA